MGSTDGLHVGSPHEIPQTHHDTKTLDQATLVTDKSHIIIRHLSVFPIGNGELSWHKQPQFHTLHLAQGCRHLFLAPHVKAYWGLDLAALGTGHPLGQY